jgi:hypothetical protein
MLDSYFDKKDWPVWMTTKSVAASFDDPRYYNGALYNTVLDRNVAQAKDNVRRSISNAHAWHRIEIARGLQAGQPESVFDTTGKFTPVWSHK